MTDNIQLLYSSRDGGSITSQECARINEDLSRLASSQVPEDQVNNVLDYLDRQFLYQQVEPHLAAPLETLSDELRARVD